VRLGSVLNLNPCILNVHKTCLGKGKGKLHPCTGTVQGCTLPLSVQAVRPIGGIEVQLYSFMTNGTRKG